MYSSMSIFHFSLCRDAHAGMISLLVSSLVLSIYLVEKKKVRMGYNVMSLPMDSSDRIWDGGGDLGKKKLGVEEKGERGQGDISFI